MLLDAKPTGLRRLAKRPELLLDLTVAMAAVAVALFWMTLL
jgi:hypothetical protein